MRYECDLRRASDVFNSLQTIISINMANVCITGLTNFFLRESKHELAQIDEENPNESMHWRVFSDKLAQWVSEPNSQRMNPLMRHFRRYWMI